MKIIKVIDEDTLEIKEIRMEDDEEVTDEISERIAGIFRQALDCTPDEFVKRYNEYQEAKKKFEEIYDPFKANIIELYKSNPDVLPKTIVVGGVVKLTYVSPSTRTSIDTKKLKEEEPALAKKFSKTTPVNATIRVEGTF